MPSSHARHLLVHQGSERPTRGFALPETPARYAPDLRLEPVHLELLLSVDLNARRLDGEVIHRVRATVPHDRIRLDAVDLEIAEVADVGGHPLSWHQDRGGIEVVWEQPFARLEERQLRIRWSVTDPLNGFIFRGPHTPESWPTRFAITDHETERARHWLPCFDHPSVRTTLDLRIRAEAGATILANGALKEEIDHEDGTATARWVLDQPCPSYLLCIAVGELVRVDLDPVDGVPIALFAPPPHDEAALRRNFGRTGEMLAWLPRRLGTAFPFPKYFQIAAPGAGGAMENISLVSWDDAFLMDEAHHGERGWLVDLINLHEMAHSWFGDSVVIRDFAHAWLKESWATYMESVWLEDTVGKDEMDWQLRNERVEYLSEMGRYRRPIVTRHFDHSWDLFDRHLYPGGALRLHMLRNLVGEEPFWAATAEYLATFGGKVAETDDFRRLMEAHSGQSLARFFDQWLRSPGHPELNIRGGWKAQDKRVELKIRQTQARKDGPVGLFDFPLEIGLQDGSGAWTIHSFEVGEEATTLFISAEDEPRAIAVDPAQKLLCTLDYDPGHDGLLRLLKCADFLAARLFAVDALGKSGTVRSAKVLRAAAGKEAHWGVRAAIAQALGKAGTLAAADALAALLNEERDPRVLHHYATAAGKIREPILAAALRTFLDGDPPPFARGAALASLGAHRDPNDLPRLEVEAIEGGDAWGWVRRGARAGLGAHQSKDSRRVLRALVGEGPQHHRVIAIAALADAGKVSSDARRGKIRQVLEDLCRDPVYAVRLAAARGLASLGDRAGLGALDRVQSMLAAQDSSALRRAVVRIKSKNPAGGSGRMDEMERELRKLRELVERLEARAR